MSARLIILRFIFVLAMLLASTSASARVDAQTRVTTFNVMRASCTELQASRRLEHRRAIRIERAENASGSCVAAEGGAARAAPSLAVDVDQLAVNAKNVPTYSDGYFNFVTHGDANSAWVLQNGEWTAMSHRTVARAIAGDAAYTGGPVRLIACNSGACAVGFARNLSNKLGVPVLAPMGAPTVEASGAVTGGGTWRLFMPGSPFH